MQCIDSQAAVLGESPLWDHREGRLYWIDIESKQIHALSIELGRRWTWPLPSKPGSLALHSDGGLLIALSNELMHFFPDSGDLKPIEGTQIEGRVRFNDGKCDARGRFWVGSMDLKEQDPIGALYCMEQGRFIQKDRQMIVSNGLGWSPDQNTMYFTDSPKKILYRYDFNLETGAISHRDIFARVREDAGYPDGLCVDQEGYVWSAHFMGGCITCYAPDGRIDRVLQMPALCPTSCCIGGAEGNQLFVTTATRDLTPSQKLENLHDGGVFMLELDVKGRREVPYRG